MGYILGHPKLMKKSIFAHTGFGHKIIIKIYYLIAIQISKFYIKKIEVTLF